ncbi:hypothetical protein [Paraburkholderia aromaticivorans]|uniref:Uncharacterized protein n=1 Tax=Paraburkholderia aromaticivorans TaxID=2026199 RepID=A0A248VX86_9BURK|nr:hypothetical protein [Paraburkholderia aromaticivorans]ASW03649.1 hypothetical protein CJU94_36205 [Paraburkholderia aromaticivorans]
MKSLQGMEIRKLGSNKGTPRMWIEGSQASRAGFLPGMKLKAKAVSVPPFVSVFKALGHALLAFKQATSISFASFVRAEAVAA